MAVNGLTSSNSINLSQVSASYENVSVSAEITKATVTATSAGSKAAVYEKSSDADKITDKSAREPKVDQETIDRLKAEAEERHANMKGLVEKLLLKQGATWDISNGLANAFRQIVPDEETIAQAQKDIAEDGYWGIEQTSDRILDFAKALAGDDPVMAAKMLDAIKKGFEQAGADWGEDLPDISQKTMEATYNKVNDWISSLGGNTGSNASGTSVSASATSVKISASYTKATYNATSATISQKTEEVKDEPAPPASVEE